MHRFRCAWQGVEGTWRWAENPLKQCKGERSPRPILIAGCSSSSSRHAAWRERQDSSVQKPDGKMLDAFVHFT